jgi:hypothetical protein
MLLAWCFSLTWSWGLHAKLSLCFLSLCFIGDNVTHVVVSQVLPDANYFLESCFCCTAPLYRPGLSLDRLGLDPVWTQLPISVVHGIDLLHRSDLVLIETSAKTATFARKKTRRDLLTRVCLNLRDAGLVFRNAADVTNFVNDELM